MNCFFQINSLLLSFDNIQNIWGCLVLTARDVVCKHAVRQ